MISSSRSSSSILSSSSNSPNRRSMSSQALKRHPTEGTGEKSSPDSTTSERSLRNDSLNPFSACSHPNTRSKRPLQIVRPPRSVKSWRARSTRPEKYCDSDSGGSGGGSISMYSSSSSGPSSSWSSSSPATADSGSTQTGSPPCACHCSIVIPWATAGTTALTSPASTVAAARSNLSRTTPSEHCAETSRSILAPSARPVGPAIPTSVSNVASMASTPSGGRPGIIFAKFSSCSVVYSPYPIGRSLRRTNSRTCRAHISKPAPQGMRVQKRVEFLVPYVVSQRRALNKLELPDRLVTPLLTSLKQSQQVLGSPRNQIELVRPTHEHPAGRQQWHNILIILIPDLIELCLVRLLKGDVPGLRRCERDHLGHRNPEILTQYPGAERRHGPALAMPGHINGKLTGGIQDLDGSGDPRNHAHGGIVKAAVNEPSHLARPCLTRCRNREEVVQPVHEALRCMDRSGQGTPERHDNSVGVLTDKARIDLFKSPARRGQRGRKCDGIAVQFSTGARDIGIRPCCDIVSARAGAEQTAIESSRQLRISFR